MKKILVGIFLITISNIALAEKIKVVYHLNEKEKVLILISSVNELIRFDPDSDVEVVIHGPAIMRLAKDTEISAEFDSLIKQGVTIGACSVSMLKKGLDPSLLVDGVVQLKKAGILRILELQKQGYGYIKI